MDLDSVVKAALILMLAVVGYIAGVLKMLHMENKKTAAELTAHKVEIARDYVPRLELVRIEQRLEQRFDKMEQWIGRRFDAMMGREDGKN